MHHFLSLYVEFSNVTEVSDIIGKYEDIKFTHDNILSTIQIHTVIFRDKNMLRLHAQLCREYNLHTVKLNRKKENKLNMWTSCCDLI